MAEPPGIDRGDLTRTLALAAEVPLTLVVGDTGFGKTTLVAQATASQNRTWLTLSPADRSLPLFARTLVDALQPRVPGFAIPLPAGSDQAGNGGVDTRIAAALASQIAQALEDLLVRDLLIVLDDFHELGSAGPSIDLIEALVRQAPRRLHLVLLSRDPVPFRIARLRSQGLVAEIGPTDLALSRDEVQHLLTAELGDTGSGLGDRIHGYTGGWPAAVRMAIEALKNRAEIDWESLDPDTIDWRGAYALLAEEVIDREPPPVVDLLRAMSLLDAFDPALCEMLGLEVDASALEAMAQRGLYVERQPRSGHLTLTPLVRSFINDHFPSDEAVAASVYGSAAVWHAGHGRHADALRCELAGDDPDAVADRLERTGLELAESGHARLVLDAIRALPPEVQVPSLDLIEGAALVGIGDAEGAVAVLSRLRDGDSLPAAAAWRLGLVHHLRGDLDEAADVYACGDGGPLEDIALLKGWWAALLWLRGDVDASRALGREALDAATRSHDARSLANAHTVLAMVAAFESDRAANEFHYVRALDWAEQAGDVMQTIRIRVNRGSRHLEEGSFLEALEELDLALTFAAVGGLTSFRALALSNRGAALLALGRMEEAIDSYQAARSQFEAIGSRLVSYPLSGMADVHRIRGERALAESRYLEAVRVAEAAEDLQGLVPPLVGLALLLAEDDTDRATTFATRALDAGPVLGRVGALIAAGWVALAAHRVDEASTHARETSTLAGARRDRVGLAQALELSARIDDDPAPLLEQAHSIWRDLGSPIGTARTELALAYVRQAGQDVVEPLRHALREHGARWDLARAEAFRSEDRATAVTITTFGGLRVARASGDVVAVGEWQSKKARDLLKILIARRGRPVPREQLMELLWPEENPSKSANRLSVALTRIRKVLAPDDETGDAVIGADAYAVALHTSQLSIDVEAFLKESAEGFRHLDGAHRAHGLELLRRAAQRYAGDFLEEDLYEDWAVDLREETRRVFIQAARVLAEEAEARGRIDESARYLLLILERDPYDEKAHLALVRAMIASGSHGEARRLYRRYVERLAELEVEPAPYPKERPQLR